MDNVSLWHIIQACINMTLAILTTVLIACSATPFWCEALAPLNLIFCCFFNSSSNKLLGIEYFIVSVIYVYHYSLTFILPLKGKFFLDIFSSVYIHLVLNFHITTGMVNKDTSSLEHLRLIWFTFCVMIYRHNFSWQKMILLVLLLLHRILLGCITFELKVILVTYQKNLILLKSHPSSSIYPPLFSGQFSDRHRDPL